MLEQYLKCIQYGKNKKEICKYLDTKQIITPARYKMQYSNYKNPNKKLAGWSNSTITNILKDRIYIGDLVQHKYASVNYKIKKIMKLEESEYIVIHDNHEAIINKEDYNKVQQMLLNRANECKRNSKELHILTGIGFCGKCGARITYTKNHGKNYKIICSNYKKNGIKACSNIYLDEQEVINTIKDKIINNIKERGITSIEVNTLKNEKISKLREEIEKNKCLIKQIYEDRKEGIIDNVNAKELLVKYINENKMAEVKIKKFFNENNKLVNIIEQINMAKREEIRSLMLLLISKVMISKELIEIEYNYF